MHRDDRHDRYYRESEFDRITDEDTEFAEEVAPRHVIVKGRKDRNNGNGDDSFNLSIAVGITGIILAVLSYFYYPFLFATIALVLGIVSVRNESDYGWWAVGLSVLALIFATIRNLWY